MAHTTAAPIAKGMQARGHLHFPQSSRCQAKGTVLSAGLYHQYPTSEIIFFPRFPLLYLTVRVVSLSTAAIRNDDVFAPQRSSRDNRSLRISPTPSMVHLPTPTAHQHPSASPDANADDSFLSFTASPIESPVYTYSEAGRRPVTIAIDVRSSTRKHTISSSSSEVERDRALEKLEKSRRRRSTKEPIVAAHDYHVENDMDWRYVIDTFLEEDL